MPATDNFLLYKKLLAELPYFIQNPG